MRIPVYQVDAFTAEAFRGNPAAVCVLEAAAPESWMQAVAAEMNLSETAFVTPGSPRGLRWFTPEAEVALCGHATLATAHVLWNEGLASRNEDLSFLTASGLLTAACNSDGWITLDLPEWVPEQGRLPAGMESALRVPAIETATVPGSIFYLAELASSELVDGADPDIAALRGYEGAVIVTAAASAGSDVDVVCRVFAPSIGIDEDPVTGSAQCALGPWWAPRLGRSELVVQQRSRRGGILRVTVPGTGRVGVAGQAVITLAGRILGPPATETTTSGVSEKR